MNASEKYDIDALRGGTYATIRAAFNCAKEILYEYGDMGSCNITSILTRLIRDTGRFNERFASDMLYALDKIRSIAEKPFALDAPFDEIFSFGIRQDGVDGGDYIMQNLLGSRSMPIPYVHPERYYRRIMAVRCRADIDPDLHRVRVDFSLRDISHSIHGLEEVDLLDGGWKLRHIPESYPATEPSPIPQEKYRVDQEEIRKAKEESFRHFELHSPDMSELMNDGCEGEFQCREILGYHKGIVPADQDKGAPICRIYKTGGTVIVSWINEWYKHYDDVKALIRVFKDGRIDENGGTGNAGAQP